MLAPPLRQLLLRIDVKEGAKQKLRNALGALQSFASKFDVKIGDVGVGIKPPAGTADSGILANDLIDLLVAVGEAAQERKTAVALFLDELQYVDESELTDLISSLHIADCLGINVESAAPLRSGLIKKGMVYSPQHGDTAFTVPLFDEYMKRVMPDMPAKKKK